MNREILFKAKRKDNGEWDYGYLMKNSKGNCYILSENLETTDIDMIEVIPKTVCQYTGLNDKNGNKIFEGDILLFDNQYKYRILFSNGKWMMQSGKNILVLLELYKFQHRSSTMLEVIGSIYDKNGV